MSATVVPAPRASAMGQQAGTPELFRLYRARATAHWLLIRGRDPDYGTGIDSRRPVWA